ncbi:hypothetical protein PQR02_00135 [Paraburkholderia sediminicola]|uniref:Uncharacterized protein n=1 Tax=Paraburkholderia rhynchosiae TaxID=487049 RepID=A0ACC7NDS8_9BURK
MRLASRCAFTLAVVATATALCLSVLAGWQRGGTLPERLVWIALGIVLVVNAHLLPALARGSPPVVGSAAVVLWVACMASACYGHATFFLLAQQHAGEQRAEAVVAVAPAVSLRSLTVVMAERAAVTRQLVYARAQRCARDCSPPEARRGMLAARLDALDAEAGDIRRHDAVVDRVTAQRDASRADPVTARLAGLLGTTVARLDLLAGLSFAAVLEGVACLLWTLALPSRVAVTDGIVMDAPVTSAVVTSPTTLPVVPSVVATKPVMPPSGKPATQGRDTVPAGYVAVRDPVARADRDDMPDWEFARLTEAVATGRVRATVADIRRHLGCSQARAAALRRQLVETNATA